MKRGRKMPQIVYLFAKVLKKSEIQHSLNPLNERAFKYALRHFSLQDEFWLHPRRCVRMAKMQGAEDEGAGSVLKYMTKPESDSNEADWLL